jgi:nitrile hydratase subunit beta
MATHLRIRLCCDAAVDGIHDLGGRHGFGPVEVEPDEPVFHADWERRVLGCTMNFFASGLTNGGRFRHSIERMDPAHYLASSYYEHWLTGVATGVVEAGKVTAAELEERAGGRFPLGLPAVAPDLDDLGAGTGSRFEVGDAVRVRAHGHAGHTRCPGYVRGRRGTVVRVDAARSVPDVEAHSDYAVREPVYCVRFDARELWREGEGFVHVDLWQCYLEAP